MACRSISSNERLWVAKLEVVLWVAKLEVVSLTLKLPEVWGNTSKAAKERRKERVLDLEVARGVGQHKQSS